MLGTKDSVSASSLQWRFASDTRSHLRSFRRPLVGHARPQDPHDLGLFRIRLQQRSLHYQQRLFLWVEGRILVVWGNWNRFHMANNSYTWSDNMIFRNDKMHVCLSIMMFWQIRTIFEKYSQWIRIFWQSLLGESRLNNNDFFRCYKVNLCC